MRKGSAIFLLWMSSVFAQEPPQELLLDPVSSPTAVFGLSGCRYRFGDHPDWSKSTQDDSDWPLFGDIFRTDAEKGIYWFRKNVKVGGETGFGKPFFIQINYLQSAADVFWDGIKVGSNGKVGKTFREENPGKAICKIELGQAFLSPGRHTLAIRLSNFRGRRWFSRGSLILGRDMPAGHFFRLPWMFRQIFFTGIFLTATVAGFALFWGGRRYRPYLIFALICLATALWRGFAFFIEYANPVNTFSNAVWFVFAIFFDIISFGIIAFVLFNFDVPKKKLPIWGAAFFCLIFRVMLIHGYIPRIVNPDFIIVLFVLLTLALLGMAIRSKKAGSVFALIGYLCYLTPQLVSVFDIVIFENSWMAAQSLFIMMILFSASRQLREQIRRQDEMGIRSRRLENELLKKTIQPHFMMNTLQSVKSLSREDPEKAAGLIDALAEELRVITSHASEKEISMAEEIRLSESHLKLMGYRWNASYFLETEGILPEEKIPPLIFHTLIENGLTHSYKPKENGTFRLVRSQKDETVRYVMSNDGSLLKRFASSSLETIGEGMGFKYIRARLEESHPGNWSLTYGLKDHLWEVVIEIRKRGKRANRDR